MKMNGVPAAVCLLLLPRSRQTWKALLPYCHLVTLGEEGGNTKDAQGSKRPVFLPGPTSKEMSGAQAELKKLHLTACIYGLYGQNKHVRKEELRISLEGMSVLGKGRLFEFVIFILISVEKKIK